MRTRLGMSVLLIAAFGASVAAPQAGTAGTQYVFTSWSDGGAASHSITVGASAATYTATFKTQYQLTISAFPAPLRVLGVRSDDE